MATTKDFDCIDFKRTAQEKIYEQIQGLTPAEEVAWFQRKVAHGPFSEWAEKLRSRQTVAYRVSHCSESEEPYNDIKKNPP